ncbi:MAG: toll/interleukin-1 receptor domain-containing protein [Gammaproteobacteria bacterium]|nr:toll/interleukin-1 receptor domain-containing protein [Gammaproteobacteria bacterium]
MDIFISWAGPDSHAVALVLRGWLPGVLPFVRPWVSSEDIRKGTRWSDKLWGRLQRTSYCIVCLTPGAVRSPWVNFEAGAVARAVGGQAHVSPLLFGISPANLGGVPLGMFQCTEFTRRDMERLVTAINAVAATPLPASEVVRRFHHQWAILHDQMGRIEIGLDDDSGKEAVSDEAMQQALQPIEDRILEYVAMSGDDWPTDVTDIAREISDNHVVTQHYVDELVRRGLLHEDPGAQGSTSFYLVTRKGRAYLVVRGLV